MILVRHFSVVWAGMGQSELGFIFSDLSLFLGPGMVGMVVSVPSLTCGRPRVAWKKTGVSMGNIFVGRVIAVIANYRSC